MQGKLDPKSPKAYVAGLIVGMGLLFGSIGYVVYRAVQAGHLSPEDEIALVRNGIQVTTEFKAIDRRWNIRLNGRSPIVVYAQGIDPTSGKPRTFVSEDYWFSGRNAGQNPELKALQILASADPRRKILIPVFMSRQKPSVYFMDLAHLSFDKENGK